MLHIPKQSITQWLMLQYMAEQRQLTDKVGFFQRKYNRTLTEFETSIELADSESFQEWDDYIEWKAYNDFLLDINQKIIEVRNGNFQIVG